MDTSSALAAFKSRQIVKADESGRTLIGQIIEVDTPTAVIRTGNGNEFNPYGDKRVMLDSITTD